MQRFITLTLIAMAMACQSTGSDAGFSGGSSVPINPKEDRAYQKAMLKCYKTGGSRVVKIEGKLRCY